MKILITLSAVVFSIDGPAYFVLIQLATALIIAVAVFHHQTKEVKQ